MTAPFLPSESFYGQQTAFRFEADVRDCEVLGNIPKAIEGRYYRTGPDTAYPTMANDVIINGDGMFSMFHFESGNVDFRCRYVQTERHMKEREARRRLYGKYRNPYTDDPSTAGTNRDNTGNTNAFFHHGRLLALREDSIPYEIDPHTLETKAIAHFEGLKSKTMTAHPHIDPVTGEWWSFGLFCHKQFKGEMAIQVFDRTGKLVREEELFQPYPGLSHDFAVTREHIIVNAMPLTVDMARVRDGGDIYAYDPSLTPMYGVIPRDGKASDVRWFKVPGGFIAHVMNAFSEGHLVHVDAACSTGNSFRFFADIHGNPTERAGVTMTRMTFNLKTGDVSLKPFEGAAGEMPKIDERYWMSPYRYGFHKAPEGIARIDWQTGERKVHSTGTPAEGNAQEPIFVPRAPDAPEGDGYILCVVNRNLENRAELVIVDTRDMEGPAVATVRLPFNQPMAFHGGFVPEHLIPKPRA